MTLIASSFSFPIGKGLLERSRPLTQVMSTVQAKLVRTEVVSSAQVALVLVGEVSSAQVALARQQLRQLSSLFKWRKLTWIGRVLRTMPASCRLRYHHTSVGIQRPIHFPQSPRSPSFQAPTRLDLSPRSCSLLCWKSRRLAPIC
jgi:hypothetical protein